MTIHEAYKKITSSEELKKKGFEALKNGKVDEFLKEQEIDLTVDQIVEYCSKIKNGKLSKEELDLAAGGECIDDTSCGGQVAWSFMTLAVGCAVSAAFQYTSSVVC